MRGESEDEDEDGGKLGRIVSECDMSIVHTYERNVRRWEPGSVWDGEDGKRAAASRECA